VIACIPINAMSLGSETLTLVGGSYVQEINDAELCRFDERKDDGC
jgi:hypothetical protein